MFRKVLSSRVILKFKKVTNNRNLHQSLRVLNANPFLYTNDFSALESKIDKHLLKNDEIVSQETVVDAIKACQNVQQSIHDYDKFWEDPTNIKINDKIQEILNNEKVEFNKELLTKVFLLKLPIATYVQIIETFYKRNPKAYIDKSIALIPFRYCLFNGDLKNALKITDMTTGHKNYVDQKNKQLRSGVLKFASSAIGITLFSKVGVQEIIELGYLSDRWRHLSSINAMILTYFLNSSFFVTIVRFGRQLIAGGGNYLTWQKGTFYTHWFRHADELSMCTKIVEADLALNGGGPSGGESSPELIEELCRTEDELYDTHTLQPGYTRDGKKIRLMEAKDNLDDIKMQAYWMSGGDGFEWVEPDQDPADLIWKQHLAKFDKPMLNTDNSTKNIKWAEELIEEK